MRLPLENPTYAPLSQTKYALSTPPKRRIARPSVADLVPYDPGFKPVDVILSANENSFGMPPAVRARVAEESEGAPENACKALVALANERGGSDNITVVTLLI